MLAGAQVLLVEDDAISLVPMGHMLVVLGAHVDVARDGREAVDLASRRRYDLILMDCQMPVMDGFEATRIIRRQEFCEALSGQRDEAQRSRHQAARVPIIAITANRRNHERCLAVGMDDCLLKPFGEARLCATLRPWRGEIRRQALQ